MERGLTRARAAAVIWQLHPAGSGDPADPEPRPAGQPAERHRAPGRPGGRRVREAGVGIRPTGGPPWSASPSGAPRPAARLHADYEMGARVLLGDVPAPADLTAFVSVVDHVLDRLRGATSTPPG